MMIRMIKGEPTSIGDIFKSQLKRRKPPAYPWQELALQIIQELRIPANKRSSVFKVCRNVPKEKVLRALHDTQELVVAGEKWRYFFKIIENEK